MTSKISPASICKIIAPAHPDAQGRAVVVLRLSVGQSDIDGATFVREPSDGVVWVVKALRSPVPWGSGLVSVFAIAEECLQLFVDLDAAPKTQAEVDIRNPTLVPA